jgi:SAM-dependent methyltransferase
MNRQDPGRPASFDLHSEHYDETVNEALAFSKLKVDFFVRAKAAYLRDIITAHFGNASTIDLLDVGCGIGNYHSHWIDHIGSLQGVDVSSKCIARAAERNPRVAYRVYDGDRLPFANYSFDAVVTICVMHHLEPRQRPGFVAELRRVTRPGGIAVVFEHNPSNFLTRRVVSNCVFDQGVILLPRQETESLMRREGFEVHPSRFILLLPPFTKLLRRVDYLFSRLPLGAQYFTCGIAKPAG